MASRLHSQHFRHLWFLSVLRQFCVSESLEMLDAKIGCVPVRCVVASLAFPASPAKIGKCQEDLVVALSDFHKEKGLKFPCTSLASADRVAISIDWG